MRISKLRTVILTGFLMWGWVTLYNLSINFFLEDHAETVRIEEIAAAKAAIANELQLAEQVRVLEEEELQRLKQEGEYVEVSLQELTAHAIRMKALGMSACLVESSSPPELVSSEKKVSS